MNYECLLGRTPGQHLPLPVLQGYLSNLRELVDELCYRTSPEPGSSYESEFGRGSFRPVGKDQAALAAEVLLHMYLQASDPNQLTILLSELQVSLPHSSFLPVPPALSILAVLGL